LASWGVYINFEYNKRRKRMKKIMLLAAVFFVRQSFAQQKHPTLMQQGNIYEVNISQ